MEKQIQQKYMELQMLGQQMQHIQKQLNMIEQQTLELDSTKESIETISKTKPGTELLVPISQGIFLKTQLKDTTELTVNVGADVAVKKTIQESKKLVTDQLVEITKFQRELSDNLEKLATKAQELEKELSKLIE